MRLAVVLVLAAGSAAAHAEGKRCIDVQFTPSDKLQIVAWVADASGAYIDTIFITQQTGTFGLGNRPGRFDFNTGPNWPYGRRITTFPVWSHANGQQFPQLIFQNDLDQDPNACFLMGGGADYPHCGENDLSHPIVNSSLEPHYCRPMMPTEPAWDTGTCATRTVGTDKGVFSNAPEKTGYPPRTDVIQTNGDSASVAMFKAMNPFDAISQPTPLAGESSHAPWPVPATLPDGNYVLYVEASKESDFNNAYNASNYPSPPGIFWSEYGVPYRGQPSVIYEVPFTISGSLATATAVDYAGYGDPNGADGNVRPPDATINTSTPGSGAARLELVSDGGDMYRVKVTYNPDVGTSAPTVPSAFTATKVQASTVDLSFVAPGAGDPAQRVSGYEIRVRASSEMTEANFADSMPVTAKVIAEDPGHTQTFAVASLLPETDYWIGLRAYDGCHNAGPVAITHVVTTARVSGSVDACFVATAAYGSVMANDVEVLRRFRDMALAANALGELGVETYYTFGPALAGVIGESDLLRSSARDVLAPIVERVKTFKL